MINVRKKKIPLLYEDGKLFTGGIDNSEDFNVFFTFLNPNPSGSETSKDERKGWHS